MLTYKDLDKTKKAFIFELDDVLYPQKDYLLQVYYLFATLLEYTETVPPANELISFFKKAYEHHGADKIFQRAASAFAIDQKYLENFNRVHVNAKLPLKLLLFEEMKELLLQVVNDNKQVFVLTKGNPLMQLNKIKQIEWGELGQKIKVYFYDELFLQGYKHPLTFLLQENGLRPKDVVIFNRPNECQYQENDGQIDCISVDLLLTSK
ncbi:MAG TPA: HAD family hydrolase [Pseudosphingobacterium sp.]|nr:HAD family hydrolase [Pseudosphingobacterium sp.]